MRTNSPAAQVGPFTYSIVVFAAAIGWMFWGEIPDLLSFGGTALVCLAGIMTIRFAGQRPLSEARLAMQAGAPARSMPFFRRGYPPGHPSRRPRKPGEKSRFIC